MSTVGVVPNIHRLMNEDGLQVRLALLLHCAMDVERMALLPHYKCRGGESSLPYSAFQRTIVHKLGERHRGGFYYSMIYIHRGFHCQ